VLLASWMGVRVTHAAIRVACEAVSVLLCSTDRRVAGVLHRGAHEERLAVVLVATTWGGTRATSASATSSALRWGALEALWAGSLGALSEGVEGAA
jgi:hypothetical protein